MLQHGHLEKLVHLEKFIHLEKFFHLVTGRGVPASSIPSNQSPTEIVFAGRLGPEISTRKNPHLEKWVTWKKFFNLVT
jgi:hypothetical protein